MFFSKLRKKLSIVRLSLFGRVFTLLAILLFTSLALWIFFFVNIQQSTRAENVAKAALDTLNVTEKTFADIPNINKKDLAATLSNNDNAQIFPRFPDDIILPPRPDKFWRIFEQTIRQTLKSPDLILASSVNNVEGVWLSFNIKSRPYWLLINEKPTVSALIDEWPAWSLIALFLALVGSLISVSLINTPLSRLVAAAQQVARGEPAAKLSDTKGPLEIRELNKAFNRMAREIRQADAERTLMMAGISHDLRTPLARIRLEIELSGLGDEVLNALDEDFAQIEHCIGQLMEYARPADLVPNKATDITAALNEIIHREMHISANRSNQCIITTQIEAKLNAYIPQFNFMRIIDNLVQNAIKYGKSSDGKTYLHISAYSDAENINIRVCDKGKGIAESELEHMTRPFTRGDTARTGVGGTGLGLAIVERLLQHSRGTLKLSANSPQGLMTHIKIPKNINSNF